MLEQSDIRVQKKREKGMLNGVTILENNPLEKGKATHSIILA